MRNTPASFAVSLLILATSSVYGRGQDARPPAGLQPQVVFTYERLGLSVPKYRFTVHSDGAAVYEGEELPPAVGPGPVGASPAQPFRHQVMISQATADRIFALGRKLDRFNTACASKAKNIADTGTKTLTYTASDGSGSCTYNYSESKEVQAETEIFEGIAETLDEGRQLDHLHRYDRLGLDDAMTLLTQEVSTGRALEVGTIAACLRSIADDADVIQRVRARARTLLAQVPDDNQAP